MRILMVEDEALIALKLTESLEHDGHEVVGPAATMAEALALCEAGRRNSRCWTLTSMTAATA